MHIRIHTYIYIYIYIYIFITENTYIHNQLHCAFISTYLHSINGEEHIIVAASGGSLHSILVTAQGRLLSFGKAEYTGHGLEDNVMSPLLLPIYSDDLGLETKVKQAAIYSGGFHTLILGTDGEIFAWGHNRVGQLGLENDFLTSRNELGVYFWNTPTRLRNVPNDIVHISVGWGRK